MPKKKNRIQTTEKKHGFLRFILQRFMMLSIMGVIMFAVAVYYGGRFYSEITRDLPDIYTLADYRPPIITSVYADDGTKIAEFYKEKRIVIPLSDMSDLLIEAFISAEDARFFTHPGIDFLGVVRAFLKNVEADTIVQGGSTITQQVTRMFLLTHKRGYRRKAKEAILAYRIDDLFTKEEILFMYLNQVYLGYGAYGVEAAAREYFGKTAKTLSLAECAMLAGLPSAPSDYAPTTDFKKAKNRQSYVLSRMVVEGYITSEEAQAAKEAPLDIRSKTNLFLENAPYYAEYVRQYIEKKYGAEMLYEQGVQIYTAVDMETQRMADQEVDQGLRALDRRRGFRGPVKRLRTHEIEEFIQKKQQAIEMSPPNSGDSIEVVVSDVDSKTGDLLVRIGNQTGRINQTDRKWAGWRGDQLNVGDVITARIKEIPEDGASWRLSLDQVPLVQGALVCLELETGKIKAMVGGLDYHTNQFNRATQARRQPGSSFKPIIYAAALDKGFTPATLLYDIPTSYKDADTGREWAPDNYDRKFLGPILLREAIAKSRNVPAVRTLEKIGVDYAIEYARKLGITSDLNMGLSLALGASGISLVEMVKAYSVFGNQGRLIEPVFVTQVLDREGHVLEENPPPPVEVIEPTTAYLMTNLLESVVKEGTGRSVNKLDRPTAGKTGTSSNLHDAWFIGYTPRYVAGVWVGFDQEQPLGKNETGSKAAAPIWLGFMQRLLKDEPVRAFQLPEDISYTVVDAETGLLPGYLTSRTLRECFKSGTEPKRTTDEDPRFRPENYIITKEEFFKSDL